MWLSCKECKNCDEREQRLSEKMKNLLSDLNLSFKDGERAAIISLKNVFNALIDSYLSIEKEKFNGNE